MPTQFQTLVAHLGRMENLSDEDCQLHAAGIPLLPVVTSGREPPFNVGMMAWNDQVVLFENQRDSYDVTLANDVRGPLLEQLMFIGRTWEVVGERFWNLSSRGDLQRFAQILKQAYGEPFAKVEPGSPVHSTLTMVLAAEGLTEFECD